MIHKEIRTHFGSALAFLLSFENLPVSIFTAPVVDVPLPVYLFRLLLYDINPVVAPIATLQILITFVILGIALKTIGTGGTVGTRSSLWQRSAKNSSTLEATADTAGSRTSAVPDR